MSITFIMENNIINIKYDFVCENIQFYVITRNNDRVVRLFMDQDSETLILWTSVVISSIAFKDSLYFFEL